MRLYFSMIILKQMKHINSKEDLEEQGINLKPRIPYGVENIIHRTVHRRKPSSFMTTKRS